VHVSDLAAAHVQALRYMDNAVGAHAFNLGNGTGTSVREIIAVAREVTGHAIPVRLEPRRPGDPAALLADPERAMRLLGWRPAFSDLETMVATAWAWHRNSAIPTPRRLVI